MVKLICDTFTEDENIRVSSFEYDSSNENDKMIMKLIDKLISANQPTCFNCQNYYRDGCFGGYMASACRVHGDIEYVGNPHYEHDGSKCPDYVRGI